jgi:hypothetical protein
MRRYVIEREIPDVGTFEREQLRGAAAKSNEVLAELIRRHAEISGFPATRIHEIGKMIDPTKSAR